MKICFYLSILLFAQIILSKCKQPNNSDELKREVEFFDPIVLGALNNTRNLTIETRFSECGEWSGHLEKIIIFADSIRRIYADYQVYPYNCDSLKYYYGNHDLSPVTEKVS